MKKHNLKVAVVGTGAAGFGVLKALENSDADITIFDVGKPISEPPPPLKRVSVSNTQAYYDRIYSEIRQAHPFKFPPPKTHFAQLLPKYKIRGRKRTLHKSESVGGLTNYWGGTMLPFTDTELEKWQINALSATIE